MISIVKIFWFSAGHTLPHHEGECANPHGHNYKLEVKITRVEYSGPVETSGPAQGMVMDFNDLTAIVSATVLRHDHKNLNDIYGNPTAEVMITSMAKEIKGLLPMGIELTTLKLWETEKCYAEWTAD